MAVSRKILIVEDEEILAENLRFYLQRCGWEARVAPTGKTAVSAAGDFRPALILLDYHLPDMDGFAALEAICHGRAACGCVLMTAHPVDAVIADARRHGIEHILSKPFALSELDAPLAATAGASERRFGAPGTQ